MTKRLTGFILAGAAGLAVLLLGLAWDLAEHASDHELAAHESPLTGVKPPQRRVP